MGKRARKVRDQRLTGVRKSRPLQAGSAPVTAPAADLPWDHLPPMDRLRYMREMLLEIESEVALSVDAARDSGMSWHKIGMVFDLTGEGARKRWTTRKYE